MLISKSDSCLLIIDVQERLVPAVNAPRRVIDGCSRLLQAAGILGVPTLLTEQYPKGLGPTLPEIKEVAPEQAVFFEKTSLSAVHQDGFMDKLNAFSKKQVVIAGVEEHICVLQTAVELKEAGFDVFVVTDASSSRTQENEAAAQTRFQQENIALVSTEMVMFEWLRKAGSPEFKEIQKRLIK